MKTAVEQTNYVPPAASQCCTVYEAKNFMEVVASAYTPSNLQQYRRVDKRHFVDTRTGELREYQRQERPRMICLFIVGALTNLGVLFLLTLQDQVQNVM